jgi:OmpA family protein
MTHIRTLLALALLAFTAPVFAQAYVFGLFTRADADTRTAPSTSGSEFAMNAGAGWHFSKHLAAEVGYVGVGNLSSADGLTEFKVDGFGIAAVGTIPISGPWSLVGKVGAYALDGETTRCCSTQAKGDLGTRPLLAVGVQYHLGDALHVQALIQQINGKDGTELDKLRLFSVGAVLQF